MAGVHSTMEQHLAVHLKDLQVRIKTDAMAALDRSRKYRRSVERWVKMESRSGNPLSEEGAELKRLSSIAAADNVNDFLALIKMDQIVGVIDHLITATVELSAPVPEVDGGSCGCLTPWQHESESCGDFLLTQAMQRVRF